MNRGLGSTPARNGPSTGHPVPFSVRRSYGACCTSDRPSLWKLLTPESQNRAPGRWVRHPSLRELSPGFRDEVSSVPGEWGCSARSLYRRNESNSTYKFRTTHGSFLHCRCRSKVIRLRFFGRSWVVKGETSTSATRQIFWFLLRRIRGTYSWPPTALRAENLAIIIHLL